MRVSMVTGVKRECADGVTLLVGDLVRADYSR
jgi:hypothetical protein